MPSRAPYRPADARTPRRGILALPLAPVVRYRGVWAARHLVLCWAVIQLAAPILWLLALLVGLVVLLSWWLYV
jgi:hypothetical protein